MSTNYYVSTSGVSSNTGLSPASPWDLTTGLNHLGPGIIVNLAPGNYPPISFPSTSSGVAGNPATLLSTVKWGAVIANAPNEGVLLATQFALTYVVVDGLHITGAVNDGVGLDASHCTIRNCWIDHSGQQGINATSPLSASNILERNLIEFNGLIGGPSNVHYHGIYIGGPNHSIRDNVCRNNVGFGIQYYTGFAGVSQNGTSIYGNLTYGHVNAFGVTAWSAVDGGALPGTNFVYGNTLLDGITVYYGTIQVNNNIIFPSVLASTTPLYDSASNPAALQADYNLSSFSLPGGGTHNVLSASGGFVNTANGLYWISAASAARGKANPVIVPAVDFFGRVSPAVSDIGAFQFDALLAADNRVLDPSFSSGSDYWAILAPPPVDVVIVTAPANTAVQVGQTANFSVVATGNTALSYQWKFNGGNVGVNASAYARTNCQLSDSGGAVSVVVSDASGSKVSTNAILTVTFPPPPPPPPPPPLDVVISQQPQNQSVNVGQTAAFSVVATGNSPLNYQWHINGIAFGANSPTATKTNCQLSDSGDVVFVTVSDTSGSLNSQSASLIVSSPPPPSVDIVVHTEPSSQSVIVGQSATFTVSATGSSTLGYQWLVNASPVGINSPTYVRTNCQLADTGAVVAVLISDSSGAVVSNAATLTVSPLPPPTPTPPIPPPPVPDIVIFVQPQNQYVQVGALAVFSVTAIGAALLLYTWSFNGRVVSSGPSPLFRKANCQISDSGGTVSVMVSDSLGAPSVTSGNAILTVVTPRVSTVGAVSAQSVGGTTPVASATLVQPRNVVSVPPPSPTFKLVVTNP